MANAEPDEPKRPRFQFSLRSLMLLTAVCSVFFAALGGMIHSHQGPLKLPAGFFVLMAAATPVGIAVAVGFFLSARKWLKRRR